MLTLFTEFTEFLIIDCPRFEYMFLKQTLQIAQKYAKLHHFNRNLFVLFIEIYVTKRCIDIDMTPHSLICIRSLLQGQGCPLRTTAEGEGHPRKGHCFLTHAH